MNSKIRISEKYSQRILFFILLLIMSTFLPPDAYSSWPNMRGRDEARQEELRGRISEIRRERPRIFLTNTEIEAVRTKIEENSSVNEVYQWLKQFSYGGQYFHNLWAAPKKLQGLVVAYRLEGKPQSIFKKCIQAMDFLCDAQPDSWTYPRAVRGLSMAYDWLYEDL